MKVTASRDVHIRENRPHRDGLSNLKGILHKGFSIEVINTDDFGENIEGNATWYQDKNGDWYWSGGFNHQTNDRVGNQGLNHLVDYAKSVIVNGMPSLGGEKVCVALLDTGVNSHQDLAHVDIHRKSFVAGQSNLDPDNGHATKMAGYIFGKSSSSSKGITGLCPGAELLDLKTSKNNGQTDIAALSQALDFLIEENEFNPQILNLSISISDLTAIKTRLEKIVSKGVLIVVAAGEEDIFKVGKVAQLARYEALITVGAVSTNYLQSSNSIYPNGLDFFFENNQCWTTAPAPNEYLKEKGDSVYTAIVSGLLGRILSHNPDTSIAKSTLLTIAHSKSDLSNSSMKLYRNE